jgi:hypothetical protein
MLEDTEDSPIDFDLELVVDGNLLINEVCIDIDIDGNGDDETEDFHVSDGLDEDVLDVDKEWEIVLVTDVEIEGDSEIEGIHGSDEVDVSPFVVTTKLDFNGEELLEELFVDVETKGDTEDFHGSGELD